MTWNSGLFFWGSKNKLAGTDLCPPTTSEQTNKSERKPDGLRPAHTRGEAAAQLFVGSFALPMERERAKPLEGRAAAAHVVCVVLGCGLR